MTLISTYSINLYLYLFFYRYTSNIAKCHLDTDYIKIIIDTTLGHNKNCSEYAYFHKLLLFLH